MKYKYTGTEEPLHIVNLSGGKDSTAMLLMMLEKQMPIDYIVFADTGKDFPQMLTHLSLLEDYIHINYPNAPKITYLKADKTFDYLMFEHEKTRGKNKGKKGYGWATMHCRWCTSYLKQAVINKFAKALNEDFIYYIGVAVDEQKRLLKNTKDNIIRKYPLAEWNITEKQALQYCYEKGFDWSGLYKHFDRLSCWCCPLKNLKELKNYFKYFTYSYWQKLKDLEQKIGVKMKGKKWLYEYENKWEKEIEKGLVEVCDDSLGD